MKSLTNSRQNYFLGIDTSNYTTSIALVDQDKNILADERKILDVKKGEKGIRQSEGVFQHIKNFRELYEKISRQFDLKNIQAVAISKRPRNVEGSYMPVFVPGDSFGSVIGDTLGVPVYNFSHQEGHIMAIYEFLDIKQDEFISFHISGGTTEILYVKKMDKEFEIEILGSTKDISIGMLIDRIGVKYEIDFPSGKKMDEIAMMCKTDDLPKLPKIKIDKGSFNLSGIENHCINKLGDIEKEKVIKALFLEISRLIKELCIYFRNLKDKNTEKTFKDIPIIFAGGVSESQFIRKYIQENLENVYFGAYGRDNGVGISLLGREKWHLNQ